MSIHAPGAYAYVVHAVCEQRGASADGWLAASESPERLAAFEAEEAERVALLERGYHEAGKPVAAVVSSAIWAACPVWTVCTRRTAVRRIPR